MSIAGKQKSGELRIDVEGTDIFSVTRPLFVARLPVSQSRANSSEVPDNVLFRRRACVERDTGAR